MMIFCSMSRVFVVVGGRAEKTSGLPILPIRKHSIELEASENEAHRPAVLQRRQPRKKCASSSGSPSNHYALKVRVGAGKGSGDKITGGTGTGYSRHQHDRRLPERD